MDPSTMMMLLTALSAAGTALTSNKGERSSTYNPNQLSSIDDILKSIQGMKGSQDITQNQNYQHGQDWLQSMFNDPSFFEKFEAPIKRNYEENVIPDLANRFASQGSGGSLGSTGFRNQLAREGSNLSTNIAALRGGMQQQAVPQMLAYSQQPFSNLMSLYGQALQPTQNQYQPPSAGPFGGALAALLGAFGQGAAQKWGQSMAGTSPSVQQNPIV